MGSGWQLTIDKVRARPGLHQIVVDNAYDQNTAFLVTLVQNTLAGVSSTGDADEDTLSYLGIEGATANNIVVVDSTGAGV